MYQFESFGTQYRVIEPQPYKGVSLEWFDPEVGGWKEIPREDRLRVDPYITALCGEVLRLSSLTIGTLRSTERVRRALESWKRETHAHGELMEGLRKVLGVSQREPMDESDAIARVRTIIDQCRRADLARRQMAASAGMDQEESVTAAVAPWKSEVAVQRQRAENAEKRVDELAAENAVLRERLALDRPAVRLLALLLSDEGPVALEAFLAEHAGFNMTHYYWRMIAVAAWRWLREQLHLTAPAASQPQAPSPAGEFARE